MRGLGRPSVAVLVLAAGLAAPSALPAATPHAEPGSDRVAYERRPFGASCHVAVQGSHATATCHNPYVDSDMVRLHIECDRWWDPDVDTRPVDAGPATTVELRGRCWMRIRDAWVTHAREGT